MKTPSQFMKDFREYEKNNPHIYENFKKYAFQAYDKGYRNFSADFIYQVIRWEENIHDNGDIFKLTDRFKPVYARKLMKEFPETFGNFFRTRKGRSDEFNEIHENPEYES